MKRSACPSALSGGKKPFAVPRPAGAACPCASGDVRPPARKAAGAALALVKVHASEDPTREGSSEPTPLCGPPRTPLATIVPGEKASASTRKPFKPPVSKDSEMSEMYGNSDKVRRPLWPKCTREGFKPKCTSPCSPRACLAAQRLGGGPPKPRLPRYSPHLEDALVLYTPPAEACSEDVKPKCAARSLARASALRARLRPPAHALATRLRPACLRPSSRPPRPVSPNTCSPTCSPHVFPTRGVAHGCRPACRCAASARCTWCSTRSLASS